MLFRSETFHFQDLKKLSKKCMIFKLHMVSGWCSFLLFKLLCWVCASCFVLSKIILTEVVVHVCASCSILPKIMLTEVVVDVCATCSVLPKIGLRFICWMFCLLLLLPKSFLTTSVLAVVPQSCCWLCCSVFWLAVMVMLSCWLFYCSFFWLAVMVMFSCWWFYCSLFWLAVMVMLSCW